MSDERRRVLAMLAEGKIGVDEAERLLTALGQKEPAGNEQTPPTKAATGSKPQFLKVDIDPGSNKPDQRVRVKVPLGIIRAGIKLGSLMPGETRGKVSNALKDKGFDVDLNDIDAKSLDAIVEALQEMSIDVQDGDEKVRVYCE